MNKIPQSCPIIDNIHDLIDSVVECIEEGKRPYLVQALANLEAIRVKLEEVREINFNLREKCQKTSN